MLTRLSIFANRIGCPPVLSSLPLLKHLDVTLWEKHLRKPWLQTFFTYLPLCSALESLKIADADEPDHEVQSMVLPDMPLQDMPSLKHVSFLATTLRTASPYHQDACCA